MPRTPFFLPQPGSSSSSSTHSFEGVAHHWLLGWKLHRAITLAQKNARPREHIARGRSANNRSGSRSEVQHQSPRSQTTRCPLGASATSLGEGNKGRTPDPPQQDPTVISGRLQLHWERATKAVHQIPRSKTPQTSSERAKPRLHLHDQSSSCEQHPRRCSRQMSPRVPANLEQCCSYPCGVPAQAVHKGQESS